MPQESAFEGASSLWTCGRRRSKDFKDGMDGQLLLDVRLTQLQASELPAFILGSLTSIGGIIGYARTGSVPSIAAGLTVGLLVRA